MTYQVEPIVLAEQPTAVVRGLVAEEAIPEFLGGVFGEVLTAIEAQGRHPVGMPFACYLLTAAGFEVEAGFPTSGAVTPTGRVVASSLPGGPAVQVLHRGSYGEVRAAYEAAEAWLVDNDWEATGPAWETYLDGPEVAEPRTVVYLPCRPR